MKLISLLFAIFTVLCVADALLLPALAQQSPSAAIEDNKTTGPPDVVVSPGSLSFVKNFGTDIDSVEVNAPPAPDYHVSTPHDLAHPPLVGQRAPGGAPGVLARPPVTDQSEEEHERDRPDD